MGKYMSKYTELVADKNRFLDCLIDKYNEEPKEVKKSLYYNIWISVLYLKIL